MIYLVTGVPGSGKSLLMVSWIEGWLKEGRKVYANIDGIDMKGVEPPPDDWRDTPEGSVWVYDEVQQHWPSSGRPGAADRDDIRALEVHRHTGHDIVIACQHPTLVHHHVRKLVGHHSHIERMMNNRATVFTWHQAQDVSDGAMRHKADKTLWKYPKRLFGYYKSATAHTHKFKVPKKLVALGVVLLVLLAGAGYGFANAEFLFGDGPVAEVERERADRSSSAAASTQRARPVRTVSRESQSVGARLVGGSTEGLDGVELSTDWRLIGAITGAEKSVFMIESRFGDRQTVPGDGWTVRQYRDGLLTVKAPGGVMRIGWHTPIDNAGSSPMAAATSLSLQ